MSEGEAVIKFFSLSHAAFIFSWEEQGEISKQWVVSTYGIIDSNIIYLYKVEDVLRKDGTQYIAQRNLFDNSLQIKSEKEYYFLTKYYDLNQYFDCGSFTKDSTYDIMLKPRLIKCLECEECLSCLTKGWQLNK